MTITLRPVTPADQELLFTIYAGTRREELAAFGWNAAQQDAFLRMQFSAQQRSYGAAYPGADHQIILVDGKPAGRIMVYREPESLLLVDIGLLPEHRNHGVGRQLLEELVAESEKTEIPVRLQVLRTNPAARLYERLGFVKTGEDQMYFQMERTPRSR